MAAAARSSSRASSLFDVYREETDALLSTCGYEELYSGNPYDWLFLWASTTDAPLRTLRESVGLMEA